MQLKRKVTSKEAMVSSGGRMRFCTFFVQCMEFGLWCVPHLKLQDTRVVFCDVEGHQVDPADNWAEWC